MNRELIEAMRGTPPPQKTAEQMLIDKIKSLEMDLRESSELNEYLRGRINRLNRELVETSGSVTSDIQTLQEQKDWLKKRLLQYEDALRRIAYTKSDSPKSPEATIAFDALNHTKP
jgi:seryl-tRNA synthetase